jgi:hypothetical protein
VLEAARYSRIVRGGEEQAIGFYLRYLGREEPAGEGGEGADPKVLAEFAEVCEAVPERDLRPPESVRRHLRAHGVGAMSARLLARYAALVSGEEAWREIAEAIEADEHRPGSDAFRRIYFDALHAIKAWDRIVDIATEADLEQRRSATRPRPRGSSRSSPTTSRRSSTTCCGSSTGPCRTRRRRRCSSGWPASGSRRCC